MINYTSADFDIKKIGSFYSKNKTIFRVFAPESLSMNLIINNNKYEMHKNNYYFEIALSGDLEGVKYCYENDKKIVFKDPFAYYSDSNYSYVLDESKFDNRSVMPKKIKDVVLYEVSVRDFSCDDSYCGKYKRKLLAFTEKGLKLNDYYMIGLDYLKNIGISHIQLMPILSFDKDKTEYNWGYNPLAYNYINSDYILDNTNPYAFINELRNVVNVLHKNNIRITLDVVFNHVYDASKYDLDKMIPGHVFRMKIDGTYAQGSYCGNEIKSEDPFVRAYLVEMCERYIRLFDIDGIRMDLMGLLDYETVNLIEEKCKKIKSDFIVYGEGWNMGDILEENKRASSLNANKMPAIGFFNDRYRDTIIQYVFGNDSIREDVKKALSGVILNTGYSQSINYIECHDNYTFFDRILKYCQNDEYSLNVKKCKLALGLVMISRGIPFIHAGQEFLRTKKFVENSYNSDEDINKIDWNRRVENNDICDYLKALIEIRKENAVFLKEDIETNFEDYYECLVYKVGNLKIIINPSIWDHVYQDGNKYSVIFDVNGKASYTSDILSIPSYSMLICKL